MSWTTVHRVKPSRFRAAWAVLGLILSIGAATSGAEAQAASTSTGGAYALSSPRSSARSLSSPVGSRREQRDVVEEEEGRAMNAAGIGVRLGVAVTGAGSAVFQGYESGTDRRTGLHFSIPIYLGGPGFGWVIEPMLQRSSVVRSTKDTTGNVTGSEELGVLGLGGFTGPRVEIPATDELYIGFGLGVKFLYLSQDAFDYAYDLYGRIPLSVSYYVTRHMAVSVEVGLGWGASVFADPPKASIEVGSTDSGAGFADVRNVNDDPQFGTAFAWDLSVGVRLP